MAVFGAGEKTVFDKVKPVLEASFSNVMYTGGIGTAMIPKARFFPDGEGCKVNIWSLASCQLLSLQHLSCAQYDREKGA